MNIIRQLAMTALKAAIRRDWPTFRIALRMLRDCCSPTPF